MTDRENTGGWCVIIEWDDGTVGVTAIQWRTGQLKLHPSLDELQEAAFRVACEVEGEYVTDGQGGVVLDVDKQRIHNCSTSTADGIEFRVGDDQEDGYHSVYVRAMGRVTV